MQCRAIVLSMQAIREVNPNAQLIQTEDLGKITALLAYQAELENERRWLSLDCAVCLTRDRPMGYLRDYGVEEAELNWFLDNPAHQTLITIYTAIAC